MARRWKLAAIVAAAGVALYALVGFFAVPRLVQWQVPRIAAAELQRQGSVGEVRFNPFTLRLVADQLALAESDGRPLAAIERLVVQADWRSPFQRAWTLRELHVEAPTVRVAVDADGGSNIARLLETVQRHAQPAKDGEHKAMPRFVARDIVLTRGRVDVDDRQTGYAEQVTPIELRLNRLSTLPQDVEGHDFSADIASGGRVLWRGTASLNPVLAQGEVALESVRLRPPGAYLRKLMQDVVTDGTISARLPYQVAVEGGRVQARIADAAVSIDGLQAARAQAREPFAALQRLELAGLSGDLAGRSLSVDAVRGRGGQLVVHRDSHGEIDLATLATARDGPPDGDASTEPASPWKLAIRQVQLEDIRLRAMDASVQPPTTWQIDRLGVALAADAAQGPNGGAKTQLRELNLRAEGVSVAQGEARPVRIDRMTLADGNVDPATRHVQVGRLAAEGGRIRVVRDAQGAIDLQRIVNPEAVSARKKAGADWKVQAHQLAVSGLAVEVEDQALGLRTELQDVSFRAQDASTDPARPLAFEAGLRLRDGGQFAVKGQAVPAVPSVAADVQVRALPLALAQPVLQRYLHLKLAGGTVSVQGRLEAKGGGNAPVVQFAGDGEVAGLRLLESGDKPFASWRLLAAKGIKASLNGVDIPELRLVGSDASVTIQADRTINATHLLVKDRPPVVKTAARQGGPAAAAGAPSSKPFPVRIGVLRFQDSQLKFTDLSLTPPFSALIHKLDGTITGLSTQRGTRCQLALDGTVDAFGQARIRGALNPFEPQANTDVSVVFRNIDMVSQSPYAMKFAGYRIDAGKMSLDLRYQVHERELVGDHKIVIDQLTLGEKVESPDATRLPVKLAVSILKDAQGRIDLGLPVRGSLQDPEFDYGALIWKALTSVVSKILSAPFRALAGGSDDQKLESIAFDAGSAQLLPPEREKLARVAEVMTKRDQFKVSVPAGYAQENDAVALRARAVNRELARRAGLPAAAQESGNPPDLADSRMQAALRELYAQRFGDAELDRAKQAAQNAPPGAAATGTTASGADSSGGAQQKKLSAYQQFRRAMRGEPQVADTGGFYGDLLKRLEKEQALPPDALARLGQERAEAVVQALAQAGVPSARLTTAAPAAVEVEQDMVPLKLGLDVT